MEFKCEAQLVAKLPLSRQHFFRIVCGCPRGLLDKENLGKLFFSYSKVFCPNITFRKPGQIDLALCLKVACLAIFCPGQL